MDRPYAKEQNMLATVQCNDRERIYVLLDTEVIKFSNLTRRKFWIKLFHLEAICHVVRISNRTFKKKVFSAFLICSTLKYVRKYNCRQGGRLKRFSGPPAVIKDHFNEEGFDSIKAKNLGRYLERIYVLPDTELISD
jgi:hypothetical protein